MNEKELKITMSSLLHDIGKVIYREGGDVRRHSLSGYDYLKDEAGITDKDILVGVKYHHAQNLKSASLDNDSVAYIVYMADNIASATDRREREEQESGFEISAPLESVFNILNKNNKKMYYKPQLLNPDGEINYPSEDKIMFDRHYYNIVKSNISDNLKGLNYTDDYINSLIEVLEANLSFVPSSTSKNEVADISLFDHVKLTAAVASCIYQYMEENNITDYKKILFTNGKEFYDKNVFLLYSMDISGIQDFIYTIHSKNAMKMLRSKSFYLEIMMEHIIDCLLEKLHLSRANLIYSGGGHCYMLLPNTETAKNIIEDYNKEINGWFLENCDISLYIAGGYCECSSNSLKNYPHGSYSEIFKNISHMISEKKASKYSAKQIIKLNNIKKKDYSRECRICKRIDLVDEDGLCSMCSALRMLSSKILDDKYLFFTVLAKEEKGALQLPLGYYLVADSEETLRKRLSSEDNNFVRTYGKNRMFTGKNVSTKLWVGNYNSDANTFEEMALRSEGIKRIGVLRADVDNLGMAFVSGFNNESNNNRYVTLSRTSTLSRQLSLFFKLYINSILDNGEYSLLNSDKKKKSRDAVICYSGGDDLFIVGAWNDIIEASVDIKNKFEKFTEGTLSLSAGIGIYNHDYPISVIADEVADMESKSKSNPGNEKRKAKNSVTLMEDGATHIEYDEEGFQKEISDGTYNWDEFINELMGEKYLCIKEFFHNSDYRGITMMYNLLDLIRKQEEKINFARIVYVLARLEPDRYIAENDKQAVIKYEKFSKNIYQWIKNENISEKRGLAKDARQLKTAMMIYAYLTRDVYIENGGGNDNAD